MSVRDLHIARHFREYQPLVFAVDQEGTQDGRSLGVVSVHFFLSLAHFLKTTRKAKLGRRREEKQVKHEGHNEVVVARVRSRSFNVVIGRQGRPFVPVEVGELNAKKGNKRRRGNNAGKLPPRGAEGKSEGERKARASSIRRRQPKDSDRHKI
ncbi:hypothetical protein KQX54_007998 [Cotesia glomerata]|uniref:Uncharacterized protein n=1 Tax=Cotesia glomerata TaxID=32391 RepID=A0AAV7J7M7_COTGL|nr:hypothetical protein KQX54_007998 [Cotesia glomerata]